MKDELLFLALLLFRVTALVTGCSLLSQAKLPGVFKAALCMSLTLLLLPIAWEDHEVPSNWVLALLGELMLGYMLGWTSCLSLEIAAAAGSLLDGQSGLANATVYDPARSEPISLFSSLFRGLFALLFLQERGLTLLMAALISSLQRFPLGQISLHWINLGFIQKIGLWYFDATLHLALPFLAALWCLDLASGFLGKVLPQLNLLALSPPLKVLLAWWLTLRWCWLICPGYSTIQQKCWHLLVS